MDLHYLRLCLQRSGYSFEDLPADWTCPVCRAGKSMFQRK
ncbi:MAG: rubredoxin [[Clostridium] leptum]